MRAFSYERATSPAEAAAAAARTQGARFIAGGTNLLDLMKLQIETPAHLVDVNALGLDRIEPAADGGIRIGALELRLVKGCSRCIMTTLDPQTGERSSDREPLATLKTYREREGEVYFGQNLLPRGAGELRVGMPVEVLE